MIHTLDYQNISFSVLEKGAELCSLKLNGEEFMWDANPAFWAKTSPILFPFVGGLKNGTFKYKNKVYEGLKHGFARDCDFTLVEKRENQLSFLLKSDENTLRNYPFSFELFLTYTIIENGLKMDYQIVNLADEMMYFSLGAHPAFATPTTSNISFSDYYIEFDQTEKAPSLTVEGLLIGKKLREGVEGKVLNLTETSFDQDALIFENLNSKKISLKCKKTTRCVEVDFAGFPYLAFWNMPYAAYVCIEPWYGIADFVDTSGELTEKIGIQALAGKSSFEASLKINLTNTL